MLTDAPQRTALARNIAARVAQLVDTGGDAILAVDAFLVRLEVGVQRYGELDVNTDQRDWRRERIEEDMDAAVYRVFQAVQDGARLSETLREEARVEMVGGGG